MEQEAGWDFNCPQFVDFTKPAVVVDPNDNADSYFDFDHENGVPVLEESINDDEAQETFSTPESTVRRTTRSTAKTPQSVQGGNDTPQRVTRSAKKQTAETDVLEFLNDGGTPKMPNVRSLTKNKKPQEDEENKETPQRVTRSVKVVSPDEESEKLADEEPARPANICVDLDEWRKKSTKGALRRSAVVSQASEQKSTTKRQNISLDRQNSPTKKQRFTPTAEAGGRSQSNPRPTGLQRSKSFAARRDRSEDTTAAPRSHTRGYSKDRTDSTSSKKEALSAENQRGRPGKHTRGYSADRTRSAIAEPKKPETSKQSELKRKVPKMNAAKNTEELELEKIAFFRQELAKKRKLAQESCKMALQGSGPTVTAPVKELTVAHEFHFSTDSRIKTHPVESKHELEVKDFASILRSAKGKQANATTKHGPTKPEPFHLSEQRKKEDQQGSKFVSMAERVNAFSGTPDRFRSKPRGKQQRGRSKSPPHGVTIPKTPQFETKTRHRPVTAPTRDQLEAKEVEEAQRHQFKANPINQKIFKNPSCGVKKVVSKSPTVVEEFHLSSNHRHNRSHTRDKKEQFEFHAQPLNTKILEGTVGVKEAKKLPVTVPESPAFALKHRARIPIQEEPKVEKSLSRARAVPHFGIPFQPQPNHKITEPEPFGFEERDKKRAAVKAQKIGQIIDEENRQREFYAQPLPSHEPHLPAKRARPLTLQQPFNLDTENRGAKKAEEWASKLEEELRQQKEKAKFKANNPNVLHSEPFVPMTDHKHTTDVSEFELNTAKRTMHREVFEMRKKKKQDMLDDIRRQEEHMKEAEAKAERERLRRQAVPRANPIRHYKSVMVQQSGKPLTDPQSPRFQTDSRLRLRSALNSTNMSS